MEPQPEGHSSKRKQGKKALSISALRIDRATEVPLEGLLGQGSSLGCKNTKRHLYHAQRCAAETDEAALLTAQIWIQGKGSLVGRVVCAAGSAGRGKLENSFQSYIEEKNADAGDAQKRSAASSGSLDEGLSAFTLSLKEGHRGVQRVPLSCTKKARVLG